MAEALVVEGIRWDFDIVEPILLGAQYAAVVFDPEQLVDGFAPEVVLDALDYAACRGLDPDTLVVGGVMEGHTASGRPVVGVVLIVCPDGLAGSIEGCPKGGPSG